MSQTPKIVGIFTKKVVKKFAFTPPPHHIIATHPGHDEGVSRKARQESREKTILMKPMESFRRMTVYFCIFLSVVFLNSCNKEEDYYTFDISPEVTQKLEEFRLALNQIKLESGSSVSHKTDSESTLVAYFVAKMYKPSLSLFQAYGVSPSQLKRELGTLDPALVVLTAEIIYHTELTSRNGVSINIIEGSQSSFSLLAFLGIQSGFAQSDTIGGCLADAIGITAAFEVVEQGIAGLGKKGVLKLVRKIGGKYLGLVGVGLAAYDFADCMGWL